MSGHFLSHRPKTADKHNEVIHFILDVFPVRRNERKRRERKTECQNNFYTIDNVNDAMHAYKLINTQMDTKQDMTFWLHVRVCKTDFPLLNR